MSVRVLLVEEGSPLEGAPLRTALDGLSCETRRVARSEDAVRAARDQKPDIILLGGETARRDNYNLCRRIKSLEEISDIPLLVFSSRDDAADRVQGLSAGADDVLAFPWDRREMRARLEIQLERKRNHDALRDKLSRSMEMALRDPLTGLHNRRHMERRLPDMLALGGAALLLLDLDDFKGVNDRLGHDVGDAALKMTALALRRNLRRRDLLCRVGGDEFVAALSDISVERVARIAERLARAVSSWALPDGRVLTISIGASFAERGVDGREALRRSDRALYEAKALGGDRAHFLSEN